MTESKQLPSYDELPRSSKGVPQAWHLFGADDNVGTINLQTPEAIVEAAALVRKGRMFSLNAPIDLFDPALSPGRGKMRQHLMSLRTPNFIAYDDVLDNLFPQASSQWDSLAHASADSEFFYNGVTEAEVRTGERNGVDHWARRGIAGRAVVLDLEAGQTDYDPGTSHSFSVEDLERARISAGVEYRPGDVIVLNTGFARWYAALGTWPRMQLAQNVTTPGVEHSEEMCRYLWNAHPAGVVTDTYGFEVFPPDMRPEAAPFGFLHQVLIGGLGLALGELWWLEDLVADCRSDGIYECFLASAPLNVRGGIGSTANAVAIK